MKKLLISLLFSLMLISGQNILAPSQVEAVTLEINNQIGKQATVAVIYYDEADSAWYVEGWWKVPANSFKTIDFPRHSKDNIWVHMHNADRSWGHMRAWTVTNEKFKYVAGKNCPSGTNRRQVAFNKYEIGQTGTVRVTAR